MRTDARKLNNKVRHSPNQCVPADPNPAGFGPLNSNRRDESTMEELRNTPGAILEWRNENPKFKVFQMFDGESLVAEFSWYESFFPFAYWWPSANGCTSQGSWVFKSIRGFKRRFRAYRQGESQPVAIFEERYLEPSRVVVENSHEYLWEGAEDSLEPERKLVSASLGIVFKILRRPSLLGRKQATLELGEAASKVDDLDMLILGGWFDWARLPG